jgi:DNA-binding transcriptional MocR family regulator
VNIVSELAERLEDPTSRGLAQAVSRAIKDGVLPPGTRLPPIRSVAKELAFSPTTVSAAWGLLTRSGAIRTDGRRGTVVADIAAPVVAARYRAALERHTDFSVDLATGVPDAALLPDLSRAARALTAISTPTSYLDDPVLPELRDTLLAEWPYPAESVTVVDGAMDAVDLVARACFTLGDRVVLENPSFPPLTDLLESVGVEVIGVPVEKEGLALEPVKAAVRSGVDAIVLQPRAQNPTGVSMSPARARAIARLVRGTRTLIIEDDSAGAISSSPPLSLGTWVPERTVHIRSFSKSHGPDLRLAALTGPPEVMTAVAGRRQLGQGWSSRLLQRILYHLLTDRDSVRLVQKARAEYARRLAALADGLERHGVEVVGRDGINLWVPVHDESAAIVRLAAQGIAVAPGRFFATANGPPPHIRVTAGIVADGTDELAEALARASRTALWGPGAR